MNNQQLNQLNQGQTGQRQIQIRASDDVLKGQYANAMQVAHTREEFLMDFMNLYAHQGVGVVSARVIISPGHMKRIVAALADNVKKYETQFGKIEVAQAPADANEIGFAAR
ncbi:hypothetical protein A3J43_01245 [Candidatus Uhrbacteria bacterium RIFCSPHIGHO2_12_FULL_54_23]|uniref:DUF3467 domain-containing protein n=2 Tax=Candidatus Uhriibacteriota TaxID=1752732 RepID=A0A1F7UJK8_9BACT|nr:MAG: hypothetical protein A3J43_01245 [Candidatus Uhrbacteria bacterium RIFCSPHIGHO2_12_FULL_54_23]